MTSTAHVEVADARHGPWPDAVADQGGLLVPATAVPFAKTGSAGREPGARPGIITLTPDEEAAVIAMAARAPSLHNTQPWQFRVRDNAIELLADPDRWLRHLDPQARELMMSCGTALFGLRLGLRSLGLLPGTELLPDRAQPGLVGRVWPVGRAAMNKVEVEMVAAVPHRHTHRGAFTPGNVATRLLAALVADAAAEGVELLLVGRAEATGQLVRLVEAAAAEQQADAQVSAELRRWVRSPGSLARDGVPAWAIARGPDQSEADGPEIGQADEHGQSRDPSAHPPVPRWLPQRDFGQRDFGRRDGDETDDVPPSATAVLSTAGDTPADWLRAGQALHRLLLRAATRWVFASLQSQPMESPRQRQEVRDLLGVTGHPQLLLQLGRSNTAPATPRRLQAELRTDERWP